MRSLGLELLLASAARIHGVEPSSDMIKRASRTFADEIGAGRLTLHEGRLEALPLAAESLDGFITLNTLYFAPAVEPVFAELRRVLKPGARGVIGVADPEWMAKLPFTQHGFNLRPVADLIAALEDAGLTTERRPLGGDPTKPAYNLLLVSPA